MDAGLRGLEQLVSSLHNHSHGDAGTSLRRATTTNDIANDIIAYCRNLSTQAELGTL